MAFAPVSSVQSEGPFYYSTGTCQLGHSCRVEPGRPTSPELRINVLDISIFRKGCETFQRTIRLWGSISEFVHCQLFFLGYHHVTAVCRVELLLNLMRLWVGSEHNCLLHGLMAAKELCQESLIPITYCNYRKAKLKYLGPKHLPVP